MTDHESERAPSSPRDGPPPERTPALPLVPILVLLLVGGILLAIGLLTGGNDGKSAPPAGPQSLVIIEPADSDRVQAPLEVTFSTAAALHLSASGWQATPYHLHAILDGAEIMPGALDIRYQGDHHFRWRIKAAAPGAHTLRLVWARPDHRAIPEGASDEISFQID